MILPQKITDIILKLKFLILKSTSGEIKVLIEIAEKYFKLRSDGIIHEDAIAKIIKIEYSASQDISNTLNFVYKRKDFLDMTFEKQYGKKGLPMAHLLRLAQRIFADRYFDENLKNDKNALVDLAYKLKKHFNVVAMNMYEKYPLN